MKVPKVKQLISHNDLPALFERYEIFIIVIGIGTVFIIAGILFYQKAYKITTTIPEVAVDLPRVQTLLFEKTVEELEQKKSMAPDLPIINPFR